jgi:hypothetical protein
MNGVIVAQSYCFRLLRTLATVINLPVYHYRAPNGGAFMLSSGRPVAFIPAARTAGRGRMMPRALYRISRDL